MAEPRKHLKQRLRLLDLTSIGIAFPVATIFGFLGGRWIGGWLGHQDLGAIVGLFFGIAAGFWNFFKMVQRFSPPKQTGATSEGSEAGRDQGESSERSS